MPQPPLEVADIFRTHGEAYRRNHRLHLGQLQVMSAIEQCRTDVLGGHVLRCVPCDDQLIAYNSCRNRHCPKCCGSKADQWLEDRKAELLPVEYFHVVFTLPAQIGDIAYQNKALIYGLLLRASAESLTTIAAGAKPHELHRNGELKFFGKLAHLANAADFQKTLAPLTKVEWVVYAKEPFAGPEAVLMYLARYTHRVAISNHRLIRHDAQGVTFNWKDYRIKHGNRVQPMTLATDEFIRRFLIHVLPIGFHRIRHYGLLASPVRRKNLALLRDALDVVQPEVVVIDGIEKDKPASFVCRSCGEPMRIIDILVPKNRAPP